MSTDLTRAQAQDTLIQVVKSKYDEADFVKMATSAKWLPRLQLFGGNSDAVKTGDVPLATYALVTSKGSYIQLGKEVDILPINWRPKAMDMRGEKVISYFNPADEEFQAVQVLSGEQDSSCVFGPEFLVWVPKAVRFATLLMGSKTARREAPNIKALLGKAATLTNQLIETKKYKWHGIVSRPCSTPFDLPDPEELQVVLNDFLNPETDRVEEVQVEAAPTDREV